MPWNVYRVHTWLERKEPTDRPKITITRLRKIGSDGRVLSREDVSQENYLDEGDSGLRRWSQLRKVMDMRSAVRET